VSTTPTGPFVVTTTAEDELEGAGVTVPVIWTVACPEYDVAFGVAVIVVAAKATVGPKTRTKATTTAAIVLSVFMSITW